MTETPETQKTQNQETETIQNKTDRQEEFEDKTRRQNIEKAKQGERKN